MVTDTPGEEERCSAAAHSAARTSIGSNTMRAQQRRGRAPHRDQQEEQQERKKAYGRQRITIAEQKTNGKTSRRGRRARRARQEDERTVEQSRTEQSRAEGCSERQRDQRVGDDRPTVTKPAAPQLPSDDDDGAQARTRTRRRGEGCRGKNNELIGSESASQQWHHLDIGRLDYPSAFSTVLSFSEGPLGQF